MSVRLGLEMSDPRPVPGGSPQGSILGNYLFCATTNGLTEEINYSAPAEVSFESLNNSNEEMIEELPNNSGGNPGAVGQAEELSEDLTRIMFDDSALDESINFYRLQHRFEFDSEDSDSNTTWTQTQIDQEIGVPPNWQCNDPKIFIYIDDANAVERVRVPGSILHYSQNKPIITVHASKSEEIMKTVTVRAENIGMRVNNQKTQLLCISSSNVSDINSYIKVGLSLIHI